MFCIGLYEVDKLRRGKMRERIIRYDIQKDLGISIIYITDSASHTDVGKHAKQMQIALLSMDSPGYMMLGKQIYRENPECRICFYKSESCDLEAVLETRPIGFYRWEEHAESPQVLQDQVNDDRVFLKKLDLIVKDVLSSGGIFQYETRKNMFLIPLQDILYFQSDLKYVDIHLLDHPDQRIYGRLSDIEQVLKSNNLSNRFIRIHKSYIVNLQHIALLDKMAHTVVITNGEQLPISNAQYAMVQQGLSRSSKE